MAGFAKRTLAACLSDPGRERENNEDRVLCEPQLGIYAVVDGVGGESGGEIAAQTAVEILQARLSRRTTDAARLIREAIALANKQIWEKSQANPALSGMACVLTVAVVDGDRATIGHVGDSRLYKLRPGQISKVTKDHSPVGVREDAREISEAEAMSHPRRNEIFRDVGSAPHEPDEDGFIDIYEIAFEPDAALLICSDGLSDLVPSATILSTVEGNADQPNAVVEALIAEANRAGGKDNISVVLVEGERFASAVTARRPSAATAAIPAVRPGVRGAGVAKRRSPFGFLVGRPAFLLYGAILGACAFAAFGQGRLPIPGLGPVTPGEEPRDVLRVNTGDGDFQSISAALAQAKAGQTVEVSPGTYRETVQLKSGVAVVSPVPRGAVIVPPAGNAGPAVSAQGVIGASFEGFGIAADPQSPLQVGVQLASSRVEVEGIEVTGAQTAGIALAGGDASDIRYSYIHDNPGDGVLIDERAAPRLLHNLIARNGRSAGAPARPGVEVRGEARPELIENRLEGNAGCGLVLPAMDRRDELAGWNSFAGGGQTVCTAAPAPQVPVQTPPERRRR